MSHYWMMGVVLGLSAGLAPGPLLTLVVSETLAHNMRAGIRVALAPLISDLPIVIVTMVVLSRLSRFNTALGIISLAGGVVILKMGWDNLKTTGAESPSMTPGARSLSKGVMVNVLSPHPYLFWMSVGGPAVTRAWEVGAGAAAGFIVLFYLLLVGSKVGLAILTGRSRGFLAGRLYIRTMRGLGLVLCVLALFLMKEGLVLLEVL